MTICPADGAQAVAVAVAVTACRCLSLRPLSLLAVAVIAAARCLVQVSLTTLCLRVCPRVSIVAVVRDRSAKEIFSKIHFGVDLARESGILLSARGGKLENLIGLIRRSRREPVGRTQDGYSIRLTIVPGGGDGQTACTVQLLLSKTNWRRNEMNIRRIYGMVQADGQVIMVCGTRDEALKAYQAHDCYGLRIIESPINEGTDCPTIDWPTFLALSRPCYAGD